MSEGSVIVDGLDSEVEEVEETQTETEDSGTQEEGATTSAPSNTPQDDSQDDSTEEPKTTFKGTKVDPNPMSAVHQELANTKKLVSQMTQVLNNPELLTKYMEQVGAKTSKVEEPQAPMFSPDRIQSSEDVINALNQMGKEFSESKRAYEEKITKLESKLGGLAEGREMERRVETLHSEMTALREQYPELKPGTTNYSPELEKEIGDLYSEIGLDESGLPNGRVSLAKVTERVMKAVYQGKKAGSQEAQTVVKEKSLGKVITSSKSKQEQTESGSPETVIAQRINKLFK